MKSLGCNARAQTRLLGATASLGWDSKFSELTAGALNAHTMPDELLLVPVIIHQGQYPLYDVTVRFTDRARKAQSI
jgi:hypothetical protein